MRTQAAINPEFGGTIFQLSLLVSASDGWAIGEQNRPHWVVEAVNT